LSAVQARYLPIALSLGLDHQRGGRCRCDRIVSSTAGAAELSGFNGLDTVREQVEFGGVVHEAG
jgi:hypothetical protein